MLYALGGIAPEINLRTNNADIRTLKTALLTRMYYCEVNNEFVEPPVPNKGHVNNTLRDFRSKLVHGWHATPISLDETVEMYKGRKHTIYANARDSLEEFPVNRSDSISVAFVKCEKVNPGKAPRCIQPRNPRYNLEVGAYIKPIEHRIYKRIAKIFGDGPTVIKGYNVQEVATILSGKWHSFRAPVAIGLDAMKFDMHVSAPVLEWEHSIYNSIYGCSKLAKLLSWQIRNIGRGYCDDGSLKYEVRGKRFSGDMNTALGNCIIMCGMIYAYSRQRGVDIKLANNGDDCVVFMEREDLSKFTEGLDTWFLEMGFRMTVEDPCYDLAAIEFCQMHCIRTINGPIMVRNLPQSLSKDCLSIVPLTTEKLMREWLGAVGQCGLALTRGVPIAMEFYKNYIANGATSGKMRDNVSFKTGIHMLMQDLNTEFETIIPEARYDVFVAWGYTPDEQEIIERAIPKPIDYGELEYYCHEAYPHEHWG